MSARKRSHSALSDATEQTMKRSKPQGKKRASNAQLAAEARVRDLQQRVEDLEDFVISNGMMRSNSTSVFYQDG